MATPLPTPIRIAAERTWELTLDAELDPDAAAATPERARAVAGLLAQFRGVTAAAVRPHCEGRFLLAIVSVEGHDFGHAIDRAATFLRSSATAAGLGPLILVGARCSGCD
jgi:hypothetical protein